MVRKKKVIIIIAIILFVIISLAVGLRIRESKLRRAEYIDGKWCFDGRSYIEISYKEIEPYKETRKVVCKTTDGTWTIYEIEQYPELEFVVLRTSWEARVLKQVDQLI